ncbi:MAG: hypothetical protein Q8M58_05325, partial [Anaerolineales bacterium]|nr:hypothetical protein [Anaerolineales bacterium]
DDPLGDFAITHQGIAEIGRRIARMDIPMLVVMEGGYDNGSLPKAYSGRKYGDTAGVFRLVSFQVEWGHG